MVTNEHPLLVARCTKIIKASEKPPAEERIDAGSLFHDGSDPAPEDMYMINVRQYAKFVVNLDENVAPTDIEEGMRVGVDRVKYTIKLPLPPKIDPTVSMMQVCFVSQCF